MSYTVFVFKKYKSDDAIRGIDAHNKRELVRGNIIEEFTQYNEQLVEPRADSLLDAVTQEMSQRVTGRVRTREGRNQSVRVVEIVLSASPKFFAPGVGCELDATGRFDRRKVEDWKKASMRFLEETWGRENLLACTLHMDEQTPHIHADVVPITRDGRLSAQDWIGTKKKQEPCTMDLQRYVLPLGSRAGARAAYLHTQSSKRTTEQ